MSKTLKSGITTITAFTSLFIAGCSLQPSKTVWRTHQGDDFIITLYSDTCDSKAVLAQMTPSDLKGLGDKFKRGDVLLGDKKEARELCYVVTQDNEDGTVIYLLDDQGTSGPLFMLKKEPRDPALKDAGK